MRLVCPLMIFSTQPNQEVLTFIRLLGNMVQRACVPKRSSKMKVHFILPGTIR